MWQLVHVYIPAPYNRPGLVQQVKDTVLPRLHGGLDQALAAGWLQEVSRHRDGHRRFAIQLVDQTQYRTIPVTFLLRDGESTLQ